MNTVGDRDEGRYRDALWMPVAICALWLALLVVPPVLIGYVLGHAFTTAGAGRPQPSHVAAVHDAEIWLAVAIAGIPAVGWIIASLARWRINAILFAVVFVAAVVVDLGALYQAQRSASPRAPAPAITQCIPRSAGRGCPGG